MFSLNDGSRRKCGREFQACNSKCPSAEMGATDSIARRRADLYMDYDHIGRRGLKFKVMGQIQCKICVLYEYLLRRPASINCRPASRHQLR